MSPSSTGPAITLSDDQTNLRIAFPSTPPVVWEFDASGVTELIENLIAMREGMVPPMSTAFPVEGDKMMVDTGGAWFVQPRAENDGLILALLHRGFGWFGMFLDPGGIDALQAAIAQWRPRPTPSSSN